MECFSCEGGRSILVLKCVKERLACALFKQFQFISNETLLKQLYHQVTED